ncbi:DUF3619 family protein [Kaarinaea lacus]
MSDSKKSPLTDDILLKAAKTTLDDNSALLDEDVRQRLQQARRTAVAAAMSTSKVPSKPVIKPKWVVAAGSFAVLTMIISIVFFLNATVPETSPMASVEDMPILTAPEELELYEELDFYQWLAEEQDSVG